jgi:hypothetical protein
MERLACHSAYTQVTGAQRVEQREHLGQRWIVLRALDGGWVKRLKCLAAHAAPS